MASFGRFETGCISTCGHILTWLYNFFGPATKVTSFAKCLFNDKDVSKKITTPDFSIGCVEYGNIVARVTNSIIAPLDRSLTLIGSEGILYVPDIRNDNCPIYYKKTPPGDLENALEYRINHFKLKLENLLIFFHGIGEKSGFFLRNFHLLKILKILVQLVINL